eukprot:scaffold3890_cov33-Attheya_sp.AAC.3
MVCLYFVYRAKANEVSSAETVTLDQEAYNLEPTYGASETFRRHTITVLVYSNSTQLQCMLVDYAATEYGCLDNYSDSASDGETMRGLGAATLLLHVAQCFAFQQTSHVTVSRKSKNSNHPQDMRMPTNDSITVKKKWNKNIAISMSSNNSTTCYKTP